MSIKNRLVAARVTPGALCIILAVGGCGGASTVRQPRVPVPANADVMQLRLPIQAYMLTPEQVDQQENLRPRLIGACLQRYGFTDKSFSRPNQPVTNPLGNIMFRRYGVTDQAVARTDGYHLPQSFAGAATPISSRNNSAAENLVLGGGGAKSGPVSQSTYQGKPIPKGGCLGEVDRALGLNAGDVTSAQEPQGGMVNDIKSRSYQTSLTDQRVLTVFKKWSVCMSGKGYQISDPPSSPKPDWLKAPRPGPVEIATAEADVACKKQTNVVGVWFAVESDLQNADIEKNAEALAKIKAERDSMVKKTQQLVAQYGA
jgi:hypothetical protein